MTPSFPPSSKVFGYLQSLVVTVEHRCDYILVTLRGSLTVREIPRVRQAVVKALLDTGHVVVDLSDLRCPQPALVSVFSTALTVSGGWPTARLALFGASDELRRMLVSARVPKTVSLADDLSSARASLQQRPAQLRRHCDLPSHPDALALARLFIGETCALWSVPVVLEQRAELVCGQLVANAVEHVQSASRLILTWTAAALTVSVRDYRATPVPRPRPIDVHALGGRGMHLVTAVAHCWGAHQHPDGNTIWVNLACQPPKGTSRRPTRQAYPTVSTPARR